MAEADLSKIVNLIMENPKLIEEIKGLAGEAKKDDAPKEESQEVNERVAEAQETAGVLTPPESDARIKRHELLSALKPYVSKERGRAIESMMSLVDILDMMRSR